MDNRLFNLIRYCISFVLLCLSAFNPASFVCCAVVLLLINNFLDDVVFYKGNNRIRQDVEVNGIFSPVNGIVTLVEEDVDLFSSIKKIDPLTHEKIMSLEISKGADKNKYNHVAIFLNKLNHHVVINPATCRETKIVNSKTGNIEMVGSDELVGSNGSYLNNDALIMRYDKFFVVLTLDKYVSDYMLSSRWPLSPRLIICKGSQCDVYFNDDWIVSKKAGDVVNIGEQLAQSMYVLGDGVKIHGVTIDKKAVKNLVQSAIAKHGDLIGLFKANALKTLSTFKSPIILVSCFVGVILYTLSHLLSYVAFSSVIIFVIVRWYKNLMYCLMNYVGLKPWMEKSYSQLSKLSVIWQRKKR